MKNLAEDQRLFLEKHHIPLDKVFDATGLSRAEYRQFMGERGQLIAIGTDPCDKSGHRMRTRTGHCPQCNTANLSFLQIFVNEGLVYVASSKATGLSKVGVASDVQSRERTLNSQGYGGAKDWRVIGARKCKQAGRVESMTQKALKGFRTCKSYNKNGVQVNVKELFFCDGYTVLEAVRASIEEICPECLPPAKGPEQVEPSNKKITNLPSKYAKVTRPITTRKLAEAMGRPLPKVVKSLMEMNIFVAPDTEIADSLGAKICSPLKLKIIQQRKYDKEARKAGHKFRQKGHPAEHKVNRNQKKRKKKGIRPGSPAIIVNVLPTFGDSL